MAVFTVDQVPHLMLPQLLMDILPPQDFMERATQQTTVGKTVDGAHNVFKSAGGVRVSLSELHDPVKAGFVVDFIAQ